MSMAAKILSCIACTTLGNFIAQVLMDGDWAMATSHSLSQAFAVLIFVFVWLREDAA